MSKIKIIIFLLITAFVLSSCAGRVAPPRTVPSKLPPSLRPYEINGVRYYPIPSALGYTEEGIASWYGDDFHGKPTSSGEPYNMHGMTAAHKTLPLGTHVKVVHRENGKSIIVRVNDRGPFVSGRIIDLTYSAAKQLGMVDPGTIPVRVEAVQVATEHSVDGRTRWDAEAIPDFRFGNFAIQVGAFQKVTNALKLREAMLKQLGKVHIHPPSYYDSAGFYRVQAGQYKDLFEAQKQAATLRQQGYPAAFVVAVEE
ncbi:MAG: septal ring lytic transglycosylase RlpA family protein [Pseudomonadota bacterium]